MRKAYGLLLGASLVLAPFVSSYADVAVVDSVSTEQAAVQEQLQQANKRNAQLVLQLQQLQEEMMMLRGQLEEQAHQIGILKQQRLDDYVNLDKRISELNELIQSGAVVASGQSTDAAQTSTNTAPETTSDYKEEYKSAYNLIKERKFKEAKVAFKAYIDKHAGTPYEANAYYWLGELHIIDAEYKQAKEAFKHVLEKFPEHDKYPEALYKLATVNYELGDRETAKKQLQILIEKFESTAVNTVRKARDFLNSHYL